MRANTMTVLSIGVLICLTDASFAQETKQITCTGKVIDAQGQPIAGAKVTLYEEAYGASPYSYDVTTVEATTKADGAFSFSKSAESDGYRYGYIVAEKEGLALDCAAWDMRQDKELEIKLSQAKELSAVVVDQSGKPVSGAAVSILILQIGKEDEQHGLSFNVAPKLLTVNTDTEGKFAFTNLPAEATAEFLVKTSRRATVSTFNPEIYRGGQSMQFSPGQKDIKLIQPAEAKIEGIVVEKDTGKPAAGVKLIVMQDWNRPLYGQESVVSSKEDGTFSIDALAARRHILQLVPPREGLADWVAAPVEVVTEAGKTKSGVKVELSKGGILQVVVTEAGKQPLEKASVSVRDQRSKQWLSATSDKDGIARIRLMPGGYQLSGVYKQAFTSEMHEEAITIEEGATKRIARSLSVMPKIRGVVRDSAGKPVEGTKIMILPGGREEVNSDSEGRFEVVWEKRGWDREDMVFCLVARHEQRNLAAAMEIGEGTKTLDIKLASGVTFNGRVVAPNTKGIAGAQIRVMLRLSNWGAPLNRTPLRANGNGNFETKAIPAGRNYSIYASAEGYGDNRTEVQADNAVDNRLDIGTLTLPVANLSVSGRVVDTEGNPVPHTRIESSGFGDGQPSNRSTYADGQGNFTLDGVCAGRINIRANVERESNRLSAHVVTEGGATGIKIVVREGRSVVQYLGGKTYEQIMQSAGKVIAGVAVDENGSPVAAVPVRVCCHKKKDEKGRFSWTYSSFIDLSATTDKEGRFAIELKEDGEYNLLFSPDNFAAVIVYDIPIGKKDLKVTLERGGSITGRLVRLEKGQKVPIPNAEVKIEQTSRAAYTHLGFDRDKTTVTDSQGRFRFEHLQTQIRSDRLKPEYVPRVWQISYGSASKTIAFYDSMAIEDFELVVGPEPAQAHPLEGRALPGFDGIKIDLAADQSKNKMILVCFFDMDQRPSRNCIKQLNTRAQELDAKDVVVVAMQASKVDENTFNEWMKENDISFPVGVVQGDVEEIRSFWGVKSLPWLILTDRKHIVRAEGFAVDELNEKIRGTANVQR